MFSTAPKGSVFYWMLMWGAYNCSERAYRTHFIIRLCLAECVWSVSDPDNSYQLFSLSRSPSKFQPNFQSPGRNEGVMEREMLSIWKFPSCKFGKIRDRNDIFNVKPGMKLGAKIHFFGRIEGLQYSFRSEQIRAFVWKLTDVWKIWRGRTEKL